MHPLYDVVVRDLEQDLKGMLEEGHQEADLRAELDKAKAACSVDALLGLQQAWWDRPSPASFPYVEPNDWESIARTFPAPDSHARFAGTDADLADKLLAAWRGRCAGCQLGKPLEGTMWPDKIRKVLQAVGSWPLTDYMNPTPAGLKIDEVQDCQFFQHGQEWRNGSCRGRFDHAWPDDDLHYAIISQYLLRDHGPEFTSKQAVQKLLDYSPVWCLYAAGKNMFRTSLFGLQTPYTATYGNPCRQSLGAMIRCDPFGWGAPANPALAAKMAYKDAVNSQTRNGIYSGIFFAVLMADTLAHGDPIRAIDTAAQYVPPKSRFAEMIQLVKGWCATAKDWQQVDEAILARWPEEAKQFNHAIPNAAIVLAGLLLGKGDFTQTLGITVMCGLDTDCTGATVGSILGCALGTKGIPQHWVAPFNDTMATEVRGLPTVKITEIARQMHAIAKPNVRWR